MSGRFNTRKDCVVLHLQAPEAEYWVNILVKANGFDILVDRNFSCSHCQWNSVNEDHAPDDDKRSSGGDLFQTCLLKDGLGNVIFGINDNVGFHVLG